MILNKVRCLEVEVGDMRFEIEDSMTCMLRLGMDLMRCYDVGEDGNARQLT